LTNHKIVLSGYWRTFWR